MATFEGGLICSRNSKQQDNGKTMKHAFCTVALPEPTPLPAGAKRERDLGVSQTVRPPWPSQSNRIQFPQPVTIRACEAPHPRPQSNILHGESHIGIWPLVFILFVVEPKRPRMIQSNANRVVGIMVGIIITPISREILPEK